MASDLLYTELKAFLTTVLHGKLTAPSLATIVKHAMKFVILNESLKKLSGTDKKNVVVATISKIIEEYIESADDLTEEERQNLVFALTLAPMFIDSVADYAKVYSSEHKGKLFCC
jgi:hypothetical protein